MYTKELDYVPFYRQKPGPYCGPANAQMALDGCPDPSNRVKYDQDWLFNIIKAHNSGTPPDQGEWNTDPKGMRECLQSLSSLPVDWVEHSGPDPNEALLFILKSMNRTGFPIPALVNNGHHWVLIVGWQTDVEPTGTNKPTLQHIHIFDPQSKGASHSHFTARTWKKHFNVVDIDGVWSKKYVAICQDPS